MYAGEFTSSFNHFISDKDFKIETDIESVDSKTFKKIISLVDFNNIIDNEIDFDTIHRIFFPNISNALSIIEDIEDDKNVAYVEYQITKLLSNLSLDCFPQVFGLKIYIKEELEVHRSYLQFADFDSTGSESSAGGSSFHESDRDESESSYQVLKNIPVLEIEMDKFDINLSEFIYNQINLIKQSKLSRNFRIRKFLEVLKCFFHQIIKSLDIAYKKLSFIHFDLHLNNIMLKKTTDKYIKINNQNIETKGYIVKIIDFGRSVIRYSEKSGKSSKRSKLILNSDYTESNRDASGFFDRCAPRLEFDFIRLCVSFFEVLGDFKEIQDYPFIHFLRSFCYSRNNEIDLLDIEGFDLYEKILENGKIFNYDELLSRFLETSQKIDKVH